VRFLLIIALLVFSLEAKSLFSNDDQKDSSVYIGNLKNLLIATQKTRGLTNAYLNGNTENMLLIYGTRSDMKRAIGKMESTSLATDPVISNRATSISKALIKLNNKAFKMSAPDTFEKYTEQIEEILMLAQTVSQRTAGSLNDFGKDASTVMMETMLPLTEYVGRLRGYGSGVAARNKVEKADIEKIFALSTEVKRLNSDLSEQMNQLMTNYSSKFPKKISSEVAAVNDAVKKYTALAEKKLLKSPQDVDPDEYFDAGTDVIDLIIKVYNTTNNAILEDSKGWL
jgi:hypothetical protein